MPERLIDANKLLKMRFSKGFNDDGELLVPVREVIKAIRLAPTVDAVHVVHCKDCQHCALEFKEQRFGEPSKYIRVCLLHDHETTLDDYCSFGVRKGEKDG